MVPLTELSRIPQRQPVFSLFFPTELGLVKSTSLLSLKVHGGVGRMTQGGQSPAVRCSGPPRRQLLASRCWRRLGAVLTQLGGTIGRGIGEPSLLWQSPPGT